MKKILLVIIVIPSWLLGQWNNDFSQTQLYDWSGDTAHYRVDTLGRLQLFGPSQSNTSIIYRQSQAVLNGSWIIDVAMDFNPSSSNYCQIHLSMDQNKNGYFVRLGGADDEVSLYKSNNNQSTKIINGINDFLDLDSVNVNIKVERDSIGNWQLWAKNQEWILQGDVFDNSFNMSDTFAISCTYTSTRSQKFFFDNIIVSGNSFIDTFTNPQPNDIVINEVLFNPIDGDNDFVEIYNRSPKSLSDLLFYHPQAVEKRVFELESMPAYNNQNGTVVLIAGSIIIDEFNYHEDLHFPCLNSIDGVSLERVNTEIESQRNDNWHSASEGANFSSPTLENSQKTQANNTEDIMTLSPKIVSADNDGIDDVLQISIHLRQQGYNANILIFDAQGRLINQLVTNAFLGTNNTFYRNGLDQNGQALQRGRYIILLQALNPTAPTIVQKKTVVVNY